MSVVDVAFSYTGATQTWVVPAGVTSLVVRMWGGAGGGAEPTNSIGGGAGYTYGALSVTPGETLTIYVAQGGHAAPAASGQRYGAGGGGSTAILRGATLLAEAGGGGGGQSSRGGAGGGASGQAAETNVNTVTPAGGGTQVGPGTAGIGGRQNGFPGSGHNGGNGWAVSYYAPAAFGYGLGGRGGFDSGDAGGSGGGGGYYGGGGGGKAAAGCPGAGGSGWTGALTGATTETGNYATPGGSTDPLRAGAGEGGALTTAGSNGRVVFSYVAIPVSVSVDLTGVQALGQVGLLTMAGAAVIPVLGVVGLGQIGEALVWGVIDDRQTANWQNIAIGLAPAWDSINTVMTPSWSPVQTNPSTGWSAVGTTQDPAWGPVEM